MSITTALKARRESLTDREAGFTLIELLVVVIIIGILAAIAIPIYLGVQNNAKDASVKSDLTNEKTAIVSASTDANGFVPTAITQAGSATVNGSTVSLTDKGWSQGTNTTALAYTAGTAGANGSPSTWCVLGTSSTGNKFVVTSSGAGVTSVASTTTACTPA